MRITKLIGAQVVGLVCVGGASAAVIATPPLDASKWDEYACNVVNLGGQPVAAKVQLIDMTDGTVRVEQELLVSPGAGARVTQIEDDFGFGAFCRFELPSARSVRASITVYSGAEGRDVAHADAR